MTSRWVLVSGSLYAFFVLWAIGWDSSTATTAAIAVLVTSVEVAALSLSARGFSPAMIPVLAINGVTVAALMAWDDVQHAASVSARLRVTTEDLQNAVHIGLGFTAAFTLGAALIRAVPSPSGTRVQRPRLPGGLVAGGYAVLALTIFAQGSTLLAADQYLAATGPSWAVTLSKSLAPFGLLALCVASFRPEKHTLARIGVVLWTLVLFGMATRRLALLPGLLLVGYYLAGKRVRAWHMVTAALGTLVLAQLAITLRGSPEGIGILTLGHQLASDSAIWRGLDPRATAGNTLFSAPLTTTVQRLNLPRDIFWVSVNPLPSGWVPEWGRYAPSLRINAFTPFNGLGELASYGTPYVIGYALVAGAVVSATSRLAASMEGARRSLAQLLIVALVTLLALNLLQYNLRSGTRLIYYMVAGVLLIWITYRRGDEVTRSPQLERDPGIGSGRPPRGRDRNRRPSPGVTEAGRGRRARNLEAGGERSRVTDRADRDWGAVGGGDGPRRSCC